MPNFKATIILVLLSFSAGAADPSLHWHGLEFQEVSQLSALPDSIRQQLEIDSSGRRGVADKGMPFNVTDLVDRSLPMSRFSTAGRSGDAWLVAAEVGGRGYSVQVYLFSGDRIKQRWTLWDPPGSLEALIEQLRVTKPKLEG